MQLSDDDRITHRPQRRSPAITVAVLLLVTGGIGGIAYYYLKNPDNQQQLSALKQAVDDKVQPAAIAPPPVPVAEPAPVPDPVAASEPPLEQAAEAVPLPPLD